MIIIDGRKIREDVLSLVRKEVASLDFRPVFCDVLVGEDPASVQYVTMKARIAESAGIHFHGASFPKEITTEELVEEIKILNKMENMCGIIVQLPLPKTIDQRAVLDAIDPMLDVDCLGAVASAEFYNGRKESGFPTALACMAILDSLNLDLENKKIVVLGQGELVGRPVTALLRFRGLNPAIITKSLENKELVLNADVIISGIGKGRHITGDMVKNGVAIIDAGTSEMEGGIVGDVDFDSVKGKASYISPTPGGVGPVTVGMLLRNVLLVAKTK